MCKVKIKLTQPNLVGARAELGNMNFDELPFRALLSVYPEAYNVKVSGNIFYVLMEKPSPMICLKGRKALLTR